MSMEIVMPKTGLTNTENALDKWQVSEGEQVKKGQVLAEIESEKTTMPFESPEDGIIHLVAGEGDTVPVGGVIAHLAADQAEYESLCAAAAPAVPAAWPPAGRPSDTPDNRPTAHRLVAKTADTCRTLPPTARCPPTPSATSSSAAVSDPAVPTAKARRKRPDRHALRRPASSLRRHDTWRVRQSAACLRECSADRRVPTNR